MKDNPHNAYLYYLLLHTKIWNYILYFFIIIFSFSFLFKNQIYNFMNFYILFGTLTFETVPYLNSIFLTIISYLLVKLFCEFLSYQDFEPFKGIEYKFENKEFY